MLRIDDSLTRERTVYITGRANTAMDRAMATGADPTTWLRRAFDNADVTYGVWPDSSARFQVGVAVLKGESVFAQARDTKMTIDHRATYVRCTSEEEALAMSMVHGDDRQAAA